jgi:putative endonuclease
VPIQIARPYEETEYSAVSCGDFLRQRWDSFAGLAHAKEHLMRGIGARFVYNLRSDSDPSRHYVGRASNVDERLEWHNAGPCGYTVRYRPWRVLVSMEFPTERQAARFEKYLKSGSGRAFATRHFGDEDEGERPVS